MKSHGRTCPGIRRYERNDPDHACGEKPDVFAVQPTFKIVFICRQTGHEKDIALCAAKHLRMRAPIVIYSGMNDLVIFNTLDFLDKYFLLKRCAVFGRRLPSGVRRKIHVIALANRPVASITICSKSSKEKCHLCGGSATFAMMCPRRNSIYKRRFSKGCADWLRRKI